jgi:hypothetical protein
MTFLAFLVESFSLSAKRLKLREFNPDAKSYTIAQG